MTLPYERTKAVIQTEQFLLNLCDPKKTPRVPKSVRETARNLLRHYPNKFDMEIILNREDKNDPLETYKVFGNDNFESKKMKTVTMCDPPSGWKYGFPKAMPKQFDTFEEFNSWLISEGYPQKEIDSYGDHFYCRYWEENVAE